MGLGNWRFGAGADRVCGTATDNDKTEAQNKTTSKKGFSGPVSLNAATAKQGDIGVYLNAIGTVTPVYTATITSQVNGVISAVHYRESQIVHKGDPLIDVDSRPYQATLEQAEGMLERDTHLLEQSKMDLDRYQKDLVAQCDSETNAR